MEDIDAPEITLGVLPTVDGSAEWHYGSTKVVCSVSGPIEVKPRDEIPNVATLELVVRPVVGLSTTRETLLEDRLYSALSSVMLRQLHPRSLIQIVVQILEPGEPTDFNTRELACAINSSNAALVDAGVPLQGLVVATSVAIVGDKIVIEPDTESLKISSSTHTIAYEFVSGAPDRLLLCESTGLFSQDQLFDCLEAALPSCRTIYNSVRASLAAKVDKDNIWRS